MDDQAQVDDLYEADEQGAALLLINPLHAAGPTFPQQNSPYSPVSRRFTAPIYLRPERLPEYAAAAADLRAEVDRLAASVPLGERIDRDAVWAAKLAALELLFPLRRPRPDADSSPALDAFATSNPRHPYADNARYWVGECDYDRRNWESARREFLRVVTDHPDGNKVPDAMVKVGLCQRMLRQDEEARRTFNAVMLTYPDSQAAAVAMKLLGEMP